jgi:hypothetical protein
VLAVSEQILMTDDTKWSHDGAELTRGRHLDAALYLRWSAVS